MTYEEALAQWKADHPEPVATQVGDEIVWIEGEDYEAMAADRAQQLVDNAARAADAQQVEQRDAAILASQPTLDEYSQTLRQAGHSQAPATAEPLAGAPPPVVGLPDTQVMVGETMALLSALITALEARGVLQPGDVVTPQEGTP